MFSLPPWRKRYGYQPGFEDYIFETFHGLDLESIVTRNELGVERQSSAANASYYQPISCRNMRFVLSEAGKLGSNFQHFVDIGSGKGKACIFAARSGMFAAVTGVDFSAPLTTIALKNARRLGLKNINFDCRDATDYLLPPAKSLIFLYNPFDEIILDAFLRRNRQHFLMHSSVIAYAHDGHRGVLRNNGFKLIARFEARKVSFHRFGQID
ncbi:MAG: methyltransferase domain-containing protein [Hyphomicrobiales bacterium]